MRTSLACTPLGVLLSVTACLLADHFKICESSGFVAHANARPAGAPAAFHESRRNGIMRLRGGIEYYENRMDVQEAIKALKQVSAIKLCSISLLG